jgi:hypothetical protein
LLLGKLDDLRHRIIAIDHLAGIIGNGGEHCGDQIGVWRQRDVFLRAGVNGVDRGARVIGDAASDDRHVDALGVEPRHQVADVEADVHQQQVRTAAGAQDSERLLIAFGMGDAGALVHRELGCGGELAAERADDQESHGLAPYIREKWRIDESISYDPP